MAFDILSLEIADTTTVEVTNAAGTPQYDGDTPMTITIYSPGTPEGIKAQHLRDERSSTRAVAMMTGKTEKGAGLAKLQERAEFLASITKSLNGWNYAGKQGYESFKALYSNPKLGHVADAVEKAFSDRGNFMPGAATS